MASTLPLFGFVNCLSTVSAVHLFNKFSELKKRKFWGSGLWSKGTYYASVGHISEDAVRKYIETQKRTVQMDGASRKETKWYRYRDVCCWFGFHPKAQGAWVFSQTSNYKSRMFAICHLLSQFLFLSSYSFLQCMFIDSSLCF